VLDWNSQPLGLVDGFHPVSVLKALLLKLNIIFNYEQVTLQHLVKET
jgi:hypothetical protein